MAKGNPSTSFEVVETSLCAPVSRVGKSRRCRTRAVSTGQRKGKEQRKHDDESEGEREKAMPD